MEEIDCYNLHNYVNCQISLVNTVTVSWDTSNTKIHDLMLNEGLYRKNDGVRNCLWLNELKKAIKWKQGSVCYFYAIVNTAQTLLHVYSVSGDTDRNLYVKIDEDGYLMVKKIIISSNDSIFEKVNCVYNDLLDEEYNSYVLK
jgi:hypothetical protein